MSRDGNRNGDGQYSDIDQNQAPAEEVDQNAPKSFFSCSNLVIAQVNIVAGLMNGYSIGFVGVYSNLYGLSTNCALYKKEGSCTTLSNADCIWSEGECVWDNQARCKRDFTDAGIEVCGAQDHCQWSYSNKNCENKSGFSSSQNGIFAGAMILGCMIGSFFAGPLAKFLGPRLSFIVVGIVGIICSVVYHICTAVDQFWVLCVARLIIGVVLGLVCVAAPMHVADNAHPKYSKMIGVLFQLFTTLGIFFAATVGLGVGQSVQYDTDSNQNLMPRMQALCVFSTFFSLLVLIMGFFMKSKKKAAKASNNTEGDEPGQEEEEEQEEKAVKQYGWCEMLPRVIMGGVVAGTLQLTGINAVMNYAPTIMGNLGLAPLVGNFIVMAWNFITTIFSVPLAAVFTMRQLFLFGSAFTSCMCLCLCGIPVYPGVSAPSVKNGVAITGILIFIAVFEMCVGPCFFVLSQDLFPPSFRPKGASSTMVFQFIFNVIINVCYPIATEGISGGPSGNQDKGQAIAFIFFGCIGLVCFVIQVFFLHPWEEGDDEAAAEAAEDGANDENRENLGEDDDVAKKDQEEEVRVGVEQQPRNNN